MKILSLKKRKKKLLKKMSIQIAIKKIKVIIKLKQRLYFVY